MDIYSNKNVIKLLLFLFAVSIGIGTLLYTESFLKELRAEEVRKAKLFVEAYDMAQNSTDDVNLSLVLKIIQGNTTIPVIVLNEKGEIYAHRNLDPTRVDKPQYLKKQLKEMGEENEPIEILFDGDRKNTLYYKESTLLTQLRIYPMVLLGVIALFILIAYWAFSTSRKSEQNRVWNGMAKETAHQIGTPLSSLMGWIEILRSQNANPEALVEMEKDVHRLETITDRFSKVGSMPQMKKEPINEVALNAVNYLQSRISKKIALQFNSEVSQNEKVDLNVQLFGWVIENLLRNAADAIEGGGTINVNLTQNNKWYQLEVKDSGKGIPKAQQKTIFRPGFTTKSRGWGLGLSLAKRIIEEYHNGKIFVSQSEVKKGTSIKILLPKTNVSETD